MKRLERPLGGMVEPDDRARVHSGDARHAKDMSALKLGADFGVARFLDRPNPARSLRC